MSEYKVEVKNLCKNFGELEVLKDCSFNVRKGEFVCVVGPTGCGKTTFLNLLTCLIEPTSGEILLDGERANPKKHDIAYMPVLFPGFSWYNLRNGVAAPLNQIPRLHGTFFWQQVYGAISQGAETLYLAMFDEMDEGTAFFKCSNNVPVGASPFLSYEGCAPDHYLWLAGMAAKALRGETALSAQMPVRKSE